MITERFEIAGDNYQIQFEPEDHVYYVSKNGGEAVLTPSVTTVTAARSLSWGPPWGAKECSLRYEERLQDVADVLDELRMEGDSAKINARLEKSGIPKELLTKDEIREYRASYKVARDKAADLGSHTHTMIHHYRTGNLEGVEQFSQMPDVLRRFETWLEWWNDLLAKGYEDVASEVMLYNPDFNYVGTCDAVLRNPDGKLFVADWKTGKRLRDKGRYQCAAYREAYALIHDLPPEAWAPGWQVQIMVTKVKTEEATERQETDAWEAFLHFRALYGLRG